MSKPTRVSEPFDANKIATMTEPLTVRVERVKGQTRSPIPLPCYEPDGGDEAIAYQDTGTGWSIALVNSIETWLVTQWAGGGAYTFAVTDSSQPAIVHRWTSYYPQVAHPERIPPPLASSSTQPMAPPLPGPPPSMPGHQRMSNQQFPPGYTYPPAPGYPQQSPFYPPPPSPPYFGPRGGYGIDPTVANAEAGMREMRAQVETLARELASSREREQAARHSAELTREREASNERFARLEQQISALVTSAQGGQRNSETDTLRAELAETRRQAEADRRERELKELIMSTQVQHQRQIDTMQAQLLAAQQTRGPDPMITMLMDAMKDISRSNSDNFSKISQFMMSPRDVFSMTKEANSSTDQIAERTSKIFSSIIDMQQKATASILQLQPGGSDIPGMIERGVDRVAQLAERYVGGKSREVQAQAQAQADIARSQAQAMHSQAMAAHPPMLTTPPTPPMPPPPTQPTQAASSGLNGAAPSTPKPATVIPINANSPKRRGRTDEEWFGQALPIVVDLRRGVAHYLASLRMNPKRVDKAGEPEGIPPALVARHTLTAATQAIQQNIPVPILKDVLDQGMYDVFVELLLPDAPDTYRLDVVAVLREEIEGPKEPDDDDGEDVDDDGSEVTDDDIDAATKAAGNAIGKPRKLVPVAGLPSPGTPRS